MTYIFEIHKLTYAIGILVFVSCIFGIEVQAQPSHEVTEVSQVEPQYVCMVTDQRFESPQIPVTVNGKTYYGCCQGCVSRLNQDASIRHAVDIVSQDTVDKATAIIGVNSEGEVYYFESETTFQRFNSKAHQGDGQSP